MDHTNEQEDATARALRMAREEWTEPFRSALERINRLALDGRHGAMPNSWTCLNAIHEEAERILYPQKERQQNG
jgi:hypothetical protein